MYRQIGGRRRIMMGMKDSSKRNQMTFISLEDLSTRKSFGEKTEYGIWISHLFMKFY